MSEEAEDEKGQVLAAIREHVRVFGRRDWKRIRDRFPNVADRKFFRWVALVTETAPGDPRKHVRTSDLVRGEKAETLRGAVDEARELAAKNIPAAPPPEYLARTGAAGRRNIDFLAATNEIWGDVMLLRDYAMNPDPELKGTPKSIKNPMYFDTSIKRRLDVMDSALRAMQAIWDLHYMEKFFQNIVQIIVEEIGPANPEVQLRVLQRLQALNDRTGMTIHAEPGGGD